MAGLLAQVLHVTLMLAAAPVLAGLIRCVAARLAGHAGPALWHPWRDLDRLARKQPVVAEGVSRLFVAAPAGAFAASLAAAALVPSFALGMTTAPIADLLLLAGLLALARATLALAAMDTGTAAGGIAASRSMNLAAFAGPALLLVIFAFALLAGSTNLDAIMRLLRSDAQLAHAAPVFALAAAGIVALADTGRMPADGAAPDALAREYAGRHLALLQWGGALRLLTWLTLIAALFAPFGIAGAQATPFGWLLGLLAWIGKIGVLAVGLAVLEAAASRMRMARMVQLLALAVLSSLLAVILLCVGQGFA